MFDISFPDPDELMREIKRQAYAEVKNQVKKSLKVFFVPSTNSSFMPLLPVMEPKLSSPWKDAVMKCSERQRVF